METNPNIVLAEETNLAIKSSFETEESGKIFYFVNDIHKNIKINLKIQKQSTV